MPSRPVRKLAPLVLNAAALLAAACGTVKSPTAPTPVPGEPVPAPQAFTFTQIQTQILTPNCAKAGCHSRAADSDVSSRPGASPPSACACAWARCQAPGNCCWARR